MYKQYIIFSLGLVLILCNDSIEYPDGGYDYPKHVADKDTNFYYYPVKDIMSKRDSLSLTVTYLLYKQYDEPNLSLYPMQHDVFRFEYSCGASVIYLITLTKDLIIVKKSNGDASQIFDVTKLNAKENKIKDFIFRNYPYKTIDGKYRKMFYDSLMMINPKLLQPEYFIYLLKKSANYLPATKSYIKSIIRISSKEYDYLKDAINNSGYWKMPYELECYHKPGVFDGCIFSLEANTHDKYNMVNSSDCQDTLAIKFSKACQEIIKYAHLEKEIFLWSDETESDTAKKLVVHDVQLQDIKDLKAIKKPKKEQKVQVSDTTVMP